MDIFAAAQTRQHRPEYTNRAWIAAEAERLIVAAGAWVGELVTQARAMRADR